MNQNIFTGREVHKLTLDNYTCVEINEEGRRHICVKNKEIFPGSILQVQSNIDVQHNSLGVNPQYIFGLVTTKETFSDFSDFAVYGFVLFTDLPKPFYNLMNDLANKLGQAENSIQMMLAGEVA